MLVMPKPSGKSSSFSNGENNLGVKPPANSAGQNRLPGRAKCRPTAAVYNPGLMPANNTRRPGAIRSGTVLCFAAISSSRVGLRMLIANGGDVGEDDFRRTIMNDPTP